MIVSVYSCGPPLEKKKEVAVYFLRCLKRPPILSSSVSPSYTNTLLFLFLFFLSSCHSPPPHFLSVLPSGRQHLGVHKTQAVKGSPCAAVSVFVGRVHVLRVFPVLRNNYLLFLQKTPRRLNDLLKKCKVQGMFFFLFN